MCENARGNVHELAPFMMVNILGQMPCSGNSLGTIGEGYGETLWDGVTPLFAIILNIINKLGEFHGSQ